jgi:hypothetical protein
LRLGLLGDPDFGRLAMSGLPALSIRTREPKPESGPTEQRQLGCDIKVGLKFVLQYPALLASLSLGGLIRVVARSGFQQALTSHRSWAGCARRPGSCPGAGFC